MKYMISRQGNRNLANGRDENLFFGELSEARTAAQDRTTDSGEPWFVYEVQPKLMFSYRAQKAKEEDWSGTTK